LELLNKSVKMKEAIRENF